MAKFSLTTWNVENLFRPYNGDVEAKRFYELKLAYLAKIIHEISPDVIGLQEVGGEDALADLQAAVGGPYRHRACGEPDRRGIACAVLSKLRFVEAPDHIVEFPPSVLALELADRRGTPITRMGRGALRVRVMKSGFCTDVVVVHLKSKLLTFENGAFTTSDETLRAQAATLALVRRAAEAATVRTAVQSFVQRAPRAGLAVLGDFNDGPEAATTQIFQGPQGSEIGTRAFGIPDAGDETRLWNLACRIDPARRYSRIHQGEGELLDQILVSKEFFFRRRSGKRGLPRFVDSRVEGLRSIGENPNAEPASVRPDHAPVTAKFDFEALTLSRFRAKTSFAGPRTP
jgi:endonuclease/exonuclease/phosphatase family metal-dependent hydrolase